MENTKPLTTLKFSEEVAARFRQCSKKIAPNQSLALGALLDHYTNSGPAQGTGMIMKVDMLEQHLLRKIDSVIAIIRNIERTQSKPTMAMLQLLFQENGAERKSLLLERRKSSESSFAQEEDLVRELEEKNRHLKRILEHVRIDRSPAGNIHFRLDLSLQEFEQMKSRV